MHPSTARDRACYNLACWEQALELLRRGPASRHLDFSLRVLERGTRSHCELLSHGEESQ